MELNISPIMQIFQESQNPERENIHIFNTSGNLDVLSMLGSVIPQITSIEKCGPVGLIVI